ncbi:hypothetical protein EJ03DRAFT_353079 [Teratosphaeria nubilosa]|uniref:Uncharacterized protein n=1 Tax=Teratosphaeria nubilosa TaxID=161662 RepID=A0A6G1L4V1_9PEZI|nr:hypothetical protein EJ03DRAFT_353079 [Teratosphaeria nubilosa]
MPKSNKSKQPKTAVQQRSAHAKKGKERKSTTPKTTKPTPKQKQRQDKQQQLSKKAKKNQANTARNNTEHGISQAEEPMMHSHFIYQACQARARGLSLGYMITDGSDHPFHLKHVRSVLDCINASAYKYAHLERVIIALRTMGEELGMQEKATDAEGEIREAVLKHQGERLARDAHDESALVALIA